MLPLWVDLYNFATLVEYLGIGVGYFDHAPDWTPEGLCAAFLEVLDQGPEGESMREKARELAVLANKRVGREVAADIIAGLAAKGHA